MRVHDERESQLVAAPRATQNAPKKTLRGPNRMQGKRFSTILPTSEIGDASQKSKSLTAMGKACTLSSKMSLLFLDETMINSNNFKTSTICVWGGNCWRLRSSKPPLIRTLGGQPWREIHPSNRYLNLRSDAVAWIFEINEPTSSLDAGWNAFGLRGMKNCSLNLHVISSLIAQ